jgi:transposase
MTLPLLTIGAGLQRELGNSHLERIGVRVHLMKERKQDMEHGHDRNQACLDEKPVVLHADVKPPVPVAPGQPERVDYEYERKGTRNLFVYTPKYGSWLNMAEIEIAIFERKALSRRLENEAALRR